MNSNGLQGSLPLASSWSAAVWSAEFPNVSNAKEQISVTHRSSWHSNLPEWWTAQQFERSGALTFGLFVYAEEEHY